MLHLLLLVLTASSIAAVAVVKQAAAAAADKLKFEHHNVGFISLWVPAGSPRGARRLGVYRLLFSQQQLGFVCRRERSGSLLA